MNKFTQLLESELLDEDTKKSLTEAIETLKVEALAEAKNELEVEYAQKLLSEKETISNGIKELVNDLVEKEVTELKEDITYYKNIEPKYAEKLNEFKEEYTKRLSGTFEKLVESTVSEEISELKEDLMESKNNNFGMTLFEAFKGTFEQLGITEDMGALKAQLAESVEALSESKSTIAGFERGTVMEGLLKNLSGSKREVMKTLLESVDTDKLESRYNETLSKVLEDKVSNDDEVVDKKEVIVESNDGTGSDLDRIRKLSGTK